MSGKPPHPWPVGTRVTALRAGDPFGYIRPIHVRRQGTVIPHPLLRLTTHYEIVGDTYFYYIAWDDIPPATGGTWDADSPRWAPATHIAAITIQDSHSVW